MEFYLGKDVTKKSENYAKLGTTRIVSKTTQVIDGKKLNERIRSLQ